MAQDYTSLNSFPSTKKFAVSSTINIATKVMLPASCSRVQIGSVNVLNIASTGTDNSAISGDNMFVPANNVITIRLGRGQNRNDDLYISSTTSSANVHILFEEL